MEDFLIRCANYMALDRPDLWDKTSALTTLRQWVARLIDMPEGVEVINSGGFALSHFLEDDGVVEWSFARDLLSHNVFVETDDDSEDFTFDWTVNSQIIKSATVLTEAEDTL